MLPIRLESFLPGDLILSRGTPRDYAALERFHYLPGRPATWAGVWTVRYVEPTVDRNLRVPCSHRRSSGAACAGADARRGGHVGCALATEACPPSPKTSACNPRRSTASVSMAPDAAPGAEHSQTNAGRLAAVAVLSYPTVNSAARDRALGMAAWPPARKLALANRDVRTISRVVVHPQFRGVGLASRLVRVICEQCATRWVEAYAVMGRVHPFFEKGGMNRHGPSAGDGPVYYLFDRKK